MRESAVGTGVVVEVDHVIGEGAGHVKEREGADQGIEVEEEGIDYPGFPFLMVVINCDLPFHFLCRSYDKEGEGGGAAAAYAEREATRDRERRNHKSKRRKPSTFWDVAPRGFEHISPLQYKAMQGKK